MYFPLPEDFCSYGGSFSLIYANKSTQKVTKPFDEIKLTIIKNYFFREILIHLTKKSILYRFIQKVNPLIPFLDYLRTTQHLYTG